MKKLITNFLYTLLFGLAITSSAYAGNEKPKGQRNQEVTVHFEMTQSDKVYVQFLDEDDVVLWSETAEGASMYAKKFNLAQLPKGVYRIIISDEHSEYVKEVRKSQNGVEEISDSMLKIAEPIIKVIDGKLKVIMQDGVNKITRVAFEGQIGGVFFEDKMESSEQGFAKTYVLNELPKGSYTAIVSTSKKTYYETVTLD